MKASELIAKLGEISARFGDLPIAGGLLWDDSPLQKVCVLDADGCETDDPAKAAQLFLEG